jgi:formate/nitrite transporter FocA (FNT family)
MTAISHGPADPPREADSPEVHGEERRAPSGKTVYHAVLREGEEELERSTSALVWSGIAAGLSMGVSLIAEGLLHAALPEAAWTPLISKFGYSIGFLIVILGRQQLFTENTLTPILPLLKTKEAGVLLNVLRLWGAVLVANLLGAAMVALVMAKSPVFTADHREAFLEIGKHGLGVPFLTVYLRGIFAGWLIALIVWLLPFAETARIWVIIFITYIVGLAGFSHVIAGAIDVFFVVFSGQASFAKALTFIFAALLGNITGGVLLVAGLNHAQVVSGEE